MQNNLVRFLTHYGPIAAQDNLYDENIARQQKLYGIEPIEVEPTLLAALRSNFENSQPSNVILTGTAGDGKTFLCRRLHASLGGNADEWSRGAKSIIFPLSSGVNLEIIKDLSELQLDEKELLITRFSEACLERSFATVYLIAANDGQLLSAWRNRITTLSQPDPVFTAVEDLLVEGREAHDTLNLMMFNLSRRTEEGLFDRILNRVLEHPGWHDCGSCSANANCSILRNRARLREVDTYSFRARLNELLDLAGRLEQHVTIRQMLVLITNTLLGIKGWKKPLITCRKIQQKPPTREQTNPYDLAMGSNLKTQERRLHSVFAILEGFEIGRETDNKFDSLLVFGEYANPTIFDQMVQADKDFGASLYQEELTNYLEGDRSLLSRFQRALEAQRRRLFFEMKTSADGFSRWALTVFKFADEFQDLLKALQQGGKCPPHTMERILRGLNRTFTGTMVNDCGRVYFTTAGGDGRARVAPYIRYEVERKGAGKQLRCINVELSSRELPQLVLYDFGETKLEALTAFELKLTHFEYLMRVADGVLPSSFAREYFEDFRDFQLRTIVKLEEREKASQPEVDTVTLWLLEVSDKGQVQPSSPVEVTLK